MTLADPGADQRADFRADRRTRWSVAALVVLLHVLLVAGIIRAFTPRFAAQVVDTVTQAFTVEVTPSPSPTPTPSPPPPSTPPDEEGAAGSPGRKATPREAAAPPARIVIAPTPAPPVAGHGAENAAGAREEGAGTGAAGTGQGTGSGAGGGGQGGGGSPTVKIEGDINSARDYPRASRKLRIGAAVTIDLAVGIDGRVKACRIVAPSPDPAADRITCELATKRFRFRPARDASGQPVEATYRWRQRWFY